MKAILRTITLALLALGGAAANVSADNAPPANGLLKPQPLRSLSIEVISASYGHSGSQTSCIVTPRVKSVCNGRSRCVIDIGDELCPPPSTLPAGLILTLTVAYKCTPLTIARATHADKPFRMVIDCGNTVP